MKLIAFDGDDTLWTPLSGVNLSDRTPTDDQGKPDFEYRGVAGDPLTVERDDGARFRLRPEAREVLQELRKRGVLTGLVSYNHQGNVNRILETFGVRDLIDYVVAEWHTGKDRMLDKLLGQARTDGHDLGPADVTLIDDDPNNIYAGQCLRMGAGFACFGKDITDLRQVL
jgi:magnesium-dependent phosphatase-1